MKDDFLALPSPGEPLKEFKHPENIEALQAAQNRRIALFSEKLKWHEKRSLESRYKKLHNKLNRAGWNRLITQRDRLLKAYQKLMRLWRKQKSDELAKKIVALAARGIAIEKKIAALRPLNEELLAIEAKLSNHAQIVAWERKEREDTRELKREAMTWLAQIESVWRQSPRMHYKATDKRGRDFVRIPQVEKIIIRPDYVLFRIKVNAQNPIQAFFKKWSYALPYGVDIKNLVSEESLENLSAACRRQVGIRYSETGKHVHYRISRLDAPDGVPKLVRYDQLIDNYPSVDSEAHKRTAWVAGITEEQKVLIFTFHEYPHLLIGGSTKAGKSNLINVMIATLVTMNPPDKLRLVLVDNKGGVEFGQLEDLEKHLLLPLATNPESTLETLKKLAALHEQRLSKIKAAKHRNFYTYNSASNEPMSRIICFIDELASLTGQGKLTEDIHRHIIYLTSQGRATGINLVLCTQHPITDILPMASKTNLMLRFAARTPTISGSQVLLGTNSAAELDYVSGRFVVSDGFKERIIQAPLITDAQIAMAIRIANEYPAATNNELTEIEIPQLAMPAITDEDTKPQPAMRTIDEGFIIEVALKDFDGALKGRPIWKHLKGLETLEKVDEIIKKIASRQTVVHEGVTYKVRKEKGNFYKLHSYIDADALFESGKATK